MENPADSLAVAVSLTNGCLYLLAVRHKSGDFMVIFGPI